MERKLCETVKVDLPQGDCCLEYYLIKNSVLNLPPRIHLFTYGVEIIKRSCDNGEVLETKMISDVCCSVIRMNNMISVLARNTVTPMSLHDVIEDFLTEAEALVE
ncbi:MAG: hypothetical protein E7399_02820 [Ruminococcaceae bacterium]|nr:hypothetical protein [Oscillospiraceae bacterium]